MQAKSQTAIFTTSRILLGLSLMLPALGRLGSTYVQTTGYIATDFFVASTAWTIALGIFELGCAIAIAIGYKTARTAALLAAYLLVMNCIFHGFWNVEPQLQFEQQTLFFKTFGIIFGLICIGALASTLEQGRPE
jgi:uncharacterized membrane protein YphA (DoxX/SURF4 family)